MSGFYIQNLGTIGNCLRWWRPGENGYTYNLDEAGVFTEEKARALCAGRPKEDILWPCVEINNLAHFHVDSDSLATLVEKNKRLAEEKRRCDAVREKGKAVSLSRTLSQRRGMRRRRNSNHDDKGKSAAGRMGRGPGDRPSVALLSGWSRIMRTPSDILPSRPSNRPGRLHRELQAVQAQAQSGKGGPKQHQR